MDMAECRDDHLTLEQMMQVPHAFYGEPTARWRATPPRAPLHGWAAAWACCSRSNVVGCRRPRCRRGARRGSAHGAVSRWAARPSLASQRTAYPFTQCHPPHYTILLTPRAPL
jgi:hypothetical protein